MKKNLKNFNVCKMHLFFMKSKKKIIFKVQFKISNSITDFEIKLTKTKRLELKLTKKTKTDS